VSALVERLKSNLCPGHITDRVGDCISRGDCGCTEGEAIERIMALEMENATQARIIAQTVAKSRLTECELQRDTYRGLAERARAMMIQAYGGAAKMERDSNNPISAWLADFAAIAAPPKD